MKLPAKETLGHPDHLFLYEHDSQELHNPDAGDFTHLMYATRFSLVLETIQRSARGKRVLDVGCAQGNFSLTLAEQGFDVVAMDLRHSFLRYLRLKQERGEVHCVSASSDRFPFRSAAFDVVLLGEILEHVAFPEDLLLGAAELLAPGGMLVITTPNGEFLRTGLPTLASIKDRTELETRQFQPDADGHLFLVTKAELFGLVHRAGLTVKRHQFLCTPWVTGHLGFRHMSRFVPVRIRLLLDLLTLRVGMLSELVSQGQLLVAQRKQG